MMMDSNEKTAFIQKRTTAGLFALLLFGPFGSHKFYLGLNQAGAIMATVTGISVLGACFIFPLIGLLVTSLIAFAEGILYLTKTDEQFYEDYFVKKQQWF
jgi:TM2 domain-containing membrane protein YozV